MNRELAKKWEAYGGAVKVWMLPYKQLGFNEALNQLIEGDLTDEQSWFAVLDWVTVDAEIASHAPVVWRAFKQYMGKRKPHDLKGNWKIFQQFGSETILEELNIAYENTREHLLSKPLISEVVEDEVPELEP